MNRNIQSLLNKYVLILGQKINKEKAVMVFSKNVIEAMQHEVLSMQGATRAQHYEKYILLVDQNQLLLLRSNEKFGKITKLEGKAFYLKAKGRFLSSSGTINI